MDKNAIQKYAIWARNELIGQVKQRAFQYGISDKGYGEENASVINGRVLTPDEKRQRQDFVHEIQINGFEQAVEEVAYTWFNRFIALRFMEVNDYLPTHVRVFSDASGCFNPEILKDVLHLDLEGLNKAKVSELLNTNQTEELYRYLLLTQCNALNAALPEMFERLGSYTEMLLPNNILKPEGVIGKLVSDIIPEETWKDAVQIIGWMYQYYNTEPKAAVFARPSTAKIVREEIPAATQLFTPDWIVRYMVENSLGRLWLESHPNAKLKANWKYYLDEAEQTPEVAERLRFLRAENPVKSPEDIRLIDPCMGSGHILVYAFDVLMQIYESEGYNPRDVVMLILEKNIYGLDIDRRAYQLAYFSLIMKARQYNRRLFTEDVKPQVFHPAGFPDGEEYGSLVKVDTLPPRPAEKPGQLNLDDTSYPLQLNAWNFKRLLAQKYDVVVTNPPYRGLSDVNIKLSDFVKKNYPDSKSDLFAAFIERCDTFLTPRGLQSMITMESWMFLSSFEKLRLKLFASKTIVNLVHMPYLGKGGTSLGINFGTATFIMSKKQIKGYQSQYDYIRYFETDDEGVPFAFPTINERYKTADSGNFAKIPGSPVAYWVSNAMMQAFEVGIIIEKLADTRLGMATANNNLFVRYWYEVEVCAIGFGCGTRDESIQVERTWFPYNSGGDYRRWYGNFENVVNWGNDGYVIRNYSKNSNGNVNSHNYNLDYIFKECLTWSALSSSYFGIRYSPQGSLFDNAGSSLFANKEQIYYLLGFLSSKIAFALLKAISPTMNFQPGNLSALPVIVDEKRKAGIDSLVAQNIYLSRADWDSFETSWDFIRHPMICGEWTVVAAFAKWECEATERFDTLKANEEELNRIFIDIYGLQDELTPEVEDKDVTVRRADLGREIRSLISYAVGCMFGRYSLDIGGLAYAGGDWDESKYSTFIPDKDNILHICDDEYFEDDIVGRFVDFIRIAYGAETLDENLKFIADALGGKGAPREVIRSYFLNNFFADHCKIYQKRPIYWLFDSGKKNGFKALVYLHRYSRDLLAKMRTDYVHEQQERYRTQLSHIVVALNTATGAGRAKLLKQQDKLAEQLKEITVFEEKVHHLADQNITLDLDDGVKKNYEIFADVLAKI